MVISSHVNEVLPNPGLALNVLHLATSFFFFFFFLFVSLIVSETYSSTETVPYVIPHSTGYAFIRHVPCELKSGTHEKMKY